MRVVPVLALVLACRSAPAPSPAPSPAAHAQPTAPAAPSWSRGPEIVFRGMCDASGALALTDGRIAVIDDEINELVIYRDTGGDPLTRVPLGRVLGLGEPGQGKEKEADLEAIARLGDDILLGASHGRKRSGKLDPTRYRLARARLAIAPGGVTVAPTGAPYTRLIDDLLAAPALAELGLAAAAERSPKVAGGLNLEGMTSEGDELIVGARSPLIEGRALVVRLSGVAGMFGGGSPTLRGHWLLDLGGRGVRDLIRAADGGFLIAAGAPVAEPIGSAIYAWSGTGEPATALAIEPGDLNLEALERLPGGDLLALSDDGSRAVDGVECKKLPDPSRKSFRGVRLVPP